MAQANSRRSDVIHVAITTRGGGVHLMRFVVREYRPASLDEIEKTGKLDVVANEWEPTANNIQDRIDKAAISWAMDGPEWLPVGWRIIDDSELVVNPVDGQKVPFTVDRTFRQAWHDDPATKKVAVHMPRARSLHMDSIRAAREPKLAALDVEWMKAAGQKKQAAADAAEAKRQALRDLPATIQPQVDAAATPDALKAIWPAELA